MKHLRFSLAALLTYTVAAALFMPLALREWPRAIYPWGHAFIVAWLVLFPGVFAWHVEKYVRAKRQQSGPEQ